MKLFLSATAALVLAIIFTIIFDSPKDILYYWGVFTGIVVSSVIAWLQNES